MFEFRSFMPLGLTAVAGFLAFTLAAPTGALAGSTQDDTIWCLKVKDQNKVKTDFAISDLLSAAGVANPYDCSGKAKLRTICLSASRDLGDDPRGGAVVVGHACYKMRCSGSALSTGPLVGTNTLTTAFGTHQTELELRDIRGAKTVCLPISEIP